MTSSSSGTPPSAEEGRHYHELLCAGTATAPARFAEAYLEPLRAWLRRTNRRIDPALCEEAAGDAVVNLIHHPHRYRPQAGDLFRYLCMSATGDLRNLLRREARHQRGRQDLDSVEHSPNAGNYLGRDADPAHGLQVAETLAPASALIAAVRERLPPTDQVVLDLLLAGEKRTAVFAAAMGLGHLPSDEQEQCVNRAKDRVKRRIKRAREKYGRST